jgi:prophage DNA circulation protein
MGDTTRIAGTRIIEALIIAAVTGGLAIYGAQLVTSEKMEAFPKFEKGLAEMDKSTQAIALTLVRLDENLKRVNENTAQHVTRLTKDMSRIDGHINTLWPRMSHIEYDVQQTWREVERQHTIDMGEPRSSIRNPTAGARRE